jgi:hypothetical protein
MLKSVVKIILILPNPAMKSVTLSTLFNLRLAVTAFALFAAIAFTTLNGSWHPTHASSFDSAKQSLSAVGASYHVFGVSVETEASEITMGIGAPQGAASTETRKPNLKLSVNSPWIWDYTEPTRTTSTGPTQVPINGNQGTPGNPPSSPLPPTMGNSPGGSSTTLNPPVFSRLSGTFPVGDFDLELTFTNPNPSGVSALYYKVDSGTWTVFDPASSAPVLVGPDSTVTAMAKSVDPLWIDSDETDESYHAETIKLAEPKVQSNNGHGNNIDGVDMSNTGNSKQGEDSDPTMDDEKWVLVELENPNDPAYSDLEYTINGADWVAYLEPFLIRESEFADGTVVQAKATGKDTNLEDSIEESEVVIEEIVWVDPILDGPGIQMSAMKFDYTNNATVTVAFENPNGTSDTAVEYRINGGDWIRYNGVPVILDVVDYASASANIEARTVGTKPYTIGDALFEYHDSDITEDSVATATDSPVEPELYAEAWSE